MISLSEIISYINETNIVNFIIMLGILFWLVKKFNLTSMIEKSVSNIKNNIEESENTKNRSQKKHELSILRLEKLPSKIKDIEVFNEQKKKIYEEKTEKTTQASIENIKKNTDKIIKIEEKKISACLTEVTIQNSIDKARWDIIERLKNNSQLHEDFIDSSLEELEKAVIK